MRLPPRDWAQQRTLVLGGAALMFAGVFALRESVGDSETAIDLLYTIPVALVALQLGLIWGLAAAALAIALVGVWVSHSDGDVSALGVLTRAVALLAVGAVAGRFADHMRSTQLRQRHLLDSGLRLAHFSGAEEIPAMLAADAQQLVGARTAHVSLGEREAQVGDGTLASSVQVPIEVRGVSFGTLSVAKAHARPEDRLMLSTLALQAAIAEENRRLLEHERDRAQLRAELQTARLGLERRGHQLQELIASQEQQRTHLAHELHEGAAQSLAALLLGLGALERELGSEVAAPRLGELRAGVDSTLRSLRSLAVSLRPPALTLGLRAALQGLPNESDWACGEPVSVEVEDGLALDEQMETVAYRVVQEALSVIGGACAVQVSQLADELEIVIDGGPHELESERLSMLGARLELAGGSLSLTGSRLRALIPLQENPG